LLHQNVINTKTFVNKNNSILKRNTNELVEWHLLLDEWLKIRGVNFLLGKMQAH